MSNTTADTEYEDTQYVGDLTTLDECDATGYARIALASEAVNVDVANSRIEIDAGDGAFNSLSGDGTRDYVGVVVYIHKTNDTDSEFLTWVPFSNSPIVKESTSVSVPWDAEGIVQIANAA